MSTVQESVARELTLPAPSTARTWSECEPLLRPDTVKGFMVATNAALSRLVSKRLTPEATPPATGSMPESANVAEALFERAGGWDTIETAGRVRSIAIASLITSPLPVPAPPSGRPEKVLLMESLSARRSRKVPSPVMPPTVTV